MRLRMNHAAPIVPFTVPLIFDFVKSEEQRATFDFAFAPQDMGRPVVAPPGIPSDRLAILRHAFDDTVKDPEFLADGKGLLFTYCINGYGTCVPICRDNRMNPDYYRPKAFRVPLSTIGIR